MHTAAPPVELLAPAGDWDCLRAAVANGADAVYFGLQRFNARLRAGNFTENDLPEVVSFLHGRGVRARVTLNTLVFTDELADAARLLATLARHRVDAVIIQDLGVALLARELAPGLEIHASTQMTVTSPEGAAFAAQLGAKRIVLARELSLREIALFRTENLPPIEVFVHGALCVAYSGQCLTSESLGHRSANRGECAQACRMPYEMIVDGKPLDLGERRYLLSPHDLAAINEIPELLRLGVTGFKIEGRLKSPEYVAAVTAAYRRAIDDALANQPHPPSDRERYRMEMTFSRGFSTGWLHGVNHQQLVSARYGKKRGALLGRVRSTGPNTIELDRPANAKPGDGICIDTGGNPDHEQGGRILRAEGCRLTFHRGQIDTRLAKPGDRIWKTSDPALDSELRRSFSGRIAPRHPLPIHFETRGAPGSPLILTARHDTFTATARSTSPLEPARTRPLTTERLQSQLARLGGTPFTLASLDNRIEGGALLPASELNRLRRGVAADLLRQIESSDPPRVNDPLTTLDRLLPHRPEPDHASPPRLSILCRTPDQLLAALDRGARRIYLDFEDIRRYAPAVHTARSRNPDARVALATPRIQKSGEQGFFRLIENARPDGVLIRNLGGVAFFRDSPLEKIGDFSLNIANPITARTLKEAGLDLLTISPDLNAAQALQLLGAAPADWFEMTIHQHMPMFHMEHCAFAAFLSNGTDYTNCGRPCDTHKVHLRDRAGIEHPLRADVGCRNTLFNAVPQTGARHFNAFRDSGLRNFRVELLEESGAETARILDAYRNLLSGHTHGADLWKSLNATSRLGVTRGTLEG